MVDQPIVVVRGKAFREVPPELAVFSVTVSAQNKDRQVTLTQLTERAGALRVLLDDYPDAIERRETSGVQIHPQLKRGREHVIGYAGSVSTTVAMTDFEVLGELLLRLADQEQTSISGPWWQLRTSSTAGADARRDAIADALARAREYAEAVGAHVQRLIEIADEDTEGDRPMMRTMAFDVGSTGGQPELELDPQQQTVRASVVVRVAISEPTSLGG